MTPDGLRIADHALRGTAASGAPEACCVAEEDAPAAEPRFWPHQQLHPDGTHADAAGVDELWYMDLSI